MKNYLLIIASCAAAVLASACSHLCSPTSALGEKDGPPLHPPPLSAAKEAIPTKSAPSRYGNPKSYSTFGKKYQVLDNNHAYQAQGIASWYGRKFHGKRTSSGEPFDMYAMTAAHRSLPIPCYVKVENLENGKEVVVKVNDRGPFVQNRLIDLSYNAARKLGFHQTGTARVRVTAIPPLQHRTQELATAYHQKLSKNHLKRDNNVIKPQNRGKQKNKPIA